jgi:hypothetical protein
VRRANTSSIWLWTRSGEETKAAMKTKQRQAQESEETDLSRLGCCFESE